MPYPVPHARSACWDTVFKHQHAEQGNPVRVEPAPITEKGRRQQWHYEVFYAGGDVVPFNLSCVPLSYNMTRDTVLQRAPLLIPQPFTGKLCDDRTVLLDNIRSICCDYREVPEAWAYWNEFISHLPYSSSGAFDKFQNTLQLLITQHGGQIVERSRYRLNRYSTSHVYLRYNIMYACMCCCCQIALRARLCDLRYSHWGHHVRECCLLWSFNKRPFFYNYFILF
jgi:hypothetical protein